MNKKLIVIIAVIVISALGFFTFYNKRVVQDENKVAVTIFPLYDIVENIAGDEVKVVLVLPAGASPHTFDLTPRKARAISGSRAVFSIGHGLDDWTGSLVTSGDIQKAVTVDKYIKLNEFSEDVHEHEHHSEEKHHHEDEHNNDLHHKDEHHHSHDGGIDPHYWLSAPNAILISQQVYEELSILFPEKESIFEKNYNDYKSQLEELDSDIKQEFGSLSTTNIATFHNAWNYFSEEYGLNVVATFEEFPGEEPTAEYLKDFQSEIKSESVGAVFAEPQFSSKSLQPIAQDLGVIISTLDPLGGIKGRQSYIELMRYNMTSIVDSL